MFLVCEKWSLVNFVSYVTAREPVNNDDKKEDGDYRSNVTSLVKFIKKYDIKYMPEYFFDLVKIAKNVRKKNNEMRIIITLEVFHEQQCTDKMFPSVARTLARFLVKLNKNDPDNPLIEENMTFMQLHWNNEPLRKYINGLLSDESIDPNSSDPLKKRASENRIEEWKKEKKAKVESDKIFKPMIKQEIKTENSCS